MSPGSNVVSGSMDLEWIFLDPALGGFFRNAVHATNGRGVWERRTARTYDYTWVAYGSDVAAAPVYMVKVGGSLELTECDNVAFTYSLEAFLPGQDPFEDEPLVCLPGTGALTRIPVSLPAVCAGPGN